MKLFLFSIYAFFLIIILNSCHFFHKDPVVLQINSQKWTSREFAKLLAKKIHTLNITNISDDHLIEKLKKQVVTDLLMKYLVHQWANNHSVFISDTELKQAMQKIKNSYPTDEVFKLYLNRKKTIQEEWEKNIKNNLLYKKAMQKIGSEAGTPELKEIKEYYQSNPNEFKKKESILIYHIFHENKETVDKIKSILKTKEEKDLPAVAQNFIKDPQITKAQWVEKGILKVFDQAFSLKKKEISPVWSSPYAYHIIQVLDKKPPQQLKFDTVKKQISQKLTTQRQKALFIKWIDKQIKKTTILKNEEAIKKIKVKLL